MNDEPLPCPFCGSQPVSELVSRGKGLMIKCVAAGCVRPHVSFIPPRFAIAAWNTRAPSGWHDIATAPKDGTEFQAWAMNDAGSGFWEPRARINSGTGSHEILCRTDYDQEDWHTEMHIRLVAWMPRPTSPLEPPK